MTATGSPPAMTDITATITTNSIAAYGSTPRYSSPYNYVVMALQDSGTSSGYQMIGTMGTLQYTFGGKTWPAFYFSQQVAKNAELKSSGVQMWIQFKHWDSKAKSTGSFYNLSTFFNCN